MGWGESDSMRMTCILVMRPISEFLPEPRTENCRPVWCVQQAIGLTVPSTRERSSGSWQVAGGIFKQQQSWCESGRTCT